jgi:hypothetical protein
MGSVLSVIDLIGAEVDATAPTEPTTMLGSVKTGTIQISATVVPNRFVPLRFIPFTIMKPFHGDSRWGFPSSTFASTCCRSKAAANTGVSASGVYA